ncbi:hypothetical protein QR680_016385 [Steinernema hermaphroditum]|uniref:Uncharacterized protein n=1 Tax=Steinernema hermaphroditum TaxID=289476 RepID=A0AA39LMD4_9BILA|nr:hypothetical protein QR680_016385 [Steinernema hermaphroditum]
MSTPELVDSLYDRALDVSAVIHFPLKLFSMYIIIKHSPKNMGALSYFLLNVMAWNLVGNVCGTILHIHPLFPAVCFRADGPLVLLTKNENVAKYLFVGIFTSLLNCALALSFVFPYRYFAVVYPHTVNKMRYAICVGATCVHILVSIFCFVANEFFIISNVDYPEKDDLPSTGASFCFWPGGWKKYVMASGFFVAMLAFGSSITVFSYLLRRHLTNVRSSLSKQTLELHRKFLAYLLVITAVPLIFGGVPIIAYLLCALFPSFRFSREIAMTCALIIMNHGAIYSFVSIVTFKPYCKAARNLLVRRFCNDVKVFQASKVWYKKGADINS